jgi:uncharacterized surface protein with fasciclin (FAS1) repeats
MRSIRIGIALVAVIAVGATGVTSSAAGPPAAAQQSDIVDTAVAAGNFDTLAKLLTRAGLVEALKQPGPYTVFAPTDAAFAKVPKRKLRALMRNERKLKAGLLYHVAAGRLASADVVERSSIRTLNGRKVHVRLRDSKVFLNKARITTPDVGASNGVIHVINRVLIPGTR